jgi:hypothetical protein
VAYRVTTCCTYQCILVCSCSSNINTVPCVRQCTRTDGSVGSACYDWVDVSTRVATESQPVALTKYPCMFLQ